VVKAVQSTINSGDTKSGKGCSIRLCETAQHINMAEKEYSNTILEDNTPLANSTCSDDDVIKNGGEEKVNQFLDLMTMKVLKTVNATMKY
jgi:hypothetical protein